MAAVPAGEAGWIDGRDGNDVVLRVEDFQGTFEENVEIERFNPAEKFLERGEVRDSFKFESLLNTIHLFEVTDNRTVVFFPIFFEEK